MKGTWATIEIAGKSAETYAPPGSPRIAVIYLHDEDGASLRDRPAFTRWFDAFQIACITPRGRRSWWADRICTEFDTAITAERFVIEHVVHHIENAWGISSRGIALLGIGMGGQGALRLAFKYPNRFAVVAALTPSIEYHELYDRGTPLDAMYDSKEQCRQDTASLHISPLKSPPHIFFCIDPATPGWYRGSDRLQEKLTALGIAHECDLRTHASVDDQAERAMRFIHAGLEHQGRRLL